MVIMAEEMEVDDEVIGAFVGGEGQRSSVVASAEAETDEPMGQLEDEARKRKERLRNLRQKLTGQTGDDKADIPKINAPLPKPVFRSYNPSDEKLQDAAVPKARPIDIEMQVADTLEQGKTKTLVEDVDLTSLAPRKPDWDLKRDVAPKLAKLEKRTQRAIAELILERLKNTPQNLVAAVEFSADPKNRNDDVDD